MADTTSNDVGITKWKRASYSWCSINREPCHAHQQTFCHYYVQWLLYFMTMMIGSYDSRWSCAGYLASKISIYMVSYVVAPTTDRTSVSFHMIGDFERRSGWYSILHFSGHTVHFFDTAFPPPQIGITLPCFRAIQLSDIAWTFMFISSSLVQTCSNWKYFGSKLWYTLYCSTWKGQLVLFFGGGGGSFHKGSTAVYWGFFHKGSTVVYSITV